MPASDFQTALPFILRWEGGYVNHPNDPGGATNKGVTQKVYDGWRQARGLALRDVRKLTQRELQAIYEAGYWVPPRCPQLPGPLNLVQFDTAVNMGVGRAVRMLQAAVGAGVDGAFGPATQRCVDQADLGTALQSYCALRETFYRDLAARNAKLQVFLKGWLNRLNALRREIGLPGFEGVDPGVDFGDAPYILRVPDIGTDPAYD